jgi:hypothetical protein
MFILRQCFCYRLVLRNLSRRLRTFLPIKKPDSAFHPGYELIAAQSARSKTSWYYALKICAAHAIRCNFEMERRMHSEFLTTKHAKATKIGNPLL